MPWYVRADGKTATARLLAEDTALKQAGFKPPGGTIKIMPSGIEGWPDEPLPVRVLQCELTHLKNGNLRWDFTVYYPPEELRKHQLDEEELYLWSFQITCAENHPFGDPQPWITSHLPKTICPHLYRPGSKKPCLYDPHQGAEHGWSQDKTVATMAIWVLDWIVAYLIWLKEGKWPGSTR